MKNSFRDIIENNLEFYFPDNNFSIKKIKRIRTKVGSQVLCYELVNNRKEEKELYIKNVNPIFSDNILEFLKLEKYWEYLLTPKIFDFIVNKNIIIYEGIKGHTLSRDIGNYLLQLNNSNIEKKLLNCASKIGSAIGYLQKLTNKGKIKIEDMNLFLINQFESNEYVKSLIEYKFRNKIQRMIKNISKMEISIAQYHGDPTPHNILIKNDDIYLLDFSFQNNAIILDPLLFSVSLDLMRNRVPILLHSTFKKMEKNFFKAYEKVTYEYWDEPVWDLLKLLTYFHVLLKYKKRKKNFKNFFVTLLDTRYILNEIKNFELF